MMSLPTGRKRRRMEKVEIPYRTARAQKVLVGTSGRIGIALCGEVHDAIDGR